MMGTPDCLAPELVLDQPISPALDVFALGSLAVCAAVGRPPFGSGNVAAVAHRVVYEPPDLDGCPARLLSLVEACLEKQPEDRPPPRRIIESCLAHAAEMPDSSQPWLAWGLAHRAAASGFTGAAGLATAQAFNFNDGTSGTADEGQAGAEKAAVAKSRHSRLVAALAATALAAVAVIAIAVTAHLASASHSSTITSLGNTTRSSHPVTPAVGRTAGAAPSAVRVTRSRAPAHSSGRSSGAPSPSLAPVVLLSQGHPGTASSVEGYPWAAANAVDGNLNTRWSSAWSDPQWLEVDLGAIHAVREVTLYWEKAYATAFQIQASDNGVTWRNVYSTVTGTGGEQMIQVNGTGRYVRVYGTHRNTSYGYSLWEFQVSGS
jgi:serine/threonine protein kinase